MSDATKIKIAIAQSRISGNVVENGDEICRLIVLAAKQSARLVLFPEGALSGYAKAHINHPDQFDHLATAHQLERIRNVAQENRIWVVVGACHQTEDTSRPFNCQYVISDIGDLVLRNDKIYLSNTELTNWYTPGEPALNTIEIDGYKFGFAICIEATMPHHFQQLDEIGVDCVLYSTLENTPLFQTLLCGHAAAFALWIAAAEPNKSMSEQSSMLVDPNGQIKNQIVPSKDADLLVSTLDKFDRRLRYNCNWPSRGGARLAKATSTKQNDTPTLSTAKSFEF